ncbi:hypothetical protein OEZ86_009177 [Tetradesmus obliquus]|nr:hypothetical protein OEZ86_009177 [Tetradesmus obliquus]
MSSGLTKAEQLAESKKRVREAFIIFEHKEGSKLVDAKELPTICEGLIAAWLLESKDALQRDDYHTLLRAFKALDPDNTGYIEADTLEQLLGSCEDALSPEELNNMLSVSADDQGRVLYQEFALRLATDGRPI